jgi:hypothetical protein
MARLLIFILIGSLPAGMGVAALVNNMGLPKWAYYANLILLGVAGLIICQVLTMTFIKRKTPAFATNEKLDGKEPAWMTTSGMGIVPQWVSMIGLMPFSCGVSLLYPVLTSITGIALPGFPLASSGAEGSDAGIVLGWILWGLTCIWTVVSFTSFIASILDKDGSYQPPLGIDYPLELRRLIGGVYTVCMVATLLFFIFTPYSKLHLLWFVPLFHVFGTQYLAPVYQKRRRSREESIESVFNNEHQEQSDPPDENRLHKLDKFCSEVNAFRENSSKLQPLIDTIICLVGAYDEVWSKKTIEYSLHDASLDLAFKSSACHLASLVCQTTKPIPNDAFSLEEAAKIVHQLWVISPSAQVPMSTEKIVELMREAYQLQLPTEINSENATFKLGVLIVGKNLMAAIYAAMLIPEVVATSNLRSIKEGTDILTIYDQGKRH